MKVVEVPHVLGRVQHLLILLFLGDLELGSLPSAVLGGSHHIQKHTHILSFS
jgi:hypothetical protein